MGNQASFPQSTFDVPKIIHQTWRDRNLPPFIDQCVKTVRDRHPAWEYRFYTDGDWNELLEGNPFIAPDEFWGIPTGIQRSDVARMLALYRDGGAYLDVDLVAVRSLDSLIESSIDAGLVGQGTEVLLTTDHPVHSQILFSGSELLMNHFIIARPRARLIGVYLSKIIDRILSKMENDPVVATGPMALTEMVDENGGELNLCTSIFPYFWTHPFPDMVHEFVGKEAYHEIIFDGSWRSRFCPYFIHLWWHNYYSKHNMMEHYGSRIFEQLRQTAPHLLNVISNQFHEENA